MRLGFWLSLAVGALAACVSAGCTQDFDQFEPDGGSPQSCTADQKLCDGACVARSDPQYGCGDNCGSCGLPNAVSVCDGTTCAIGECSGGFSDCDALPSTGCESDVTSDPANCGACGFPCNTPNASSACAAGQCFFEQCNPGFVDCNGDLADGCETQLGTPTNCAACGDTCALPNATAACDQGACVVQTCDAGFDDCDGLAATGCEADLSSAATCGTCANACASGPNANPVCTAGTCSIACTGAFEDCDGVAATGCEADLATSTAHCGLCNNPCPSGANSTAVCNNGSCGLLCMGTFDDCNGIPNDGCEVNTATSTANCGDCGRACSPTNVAAATCAGGLCTSTCMAGFSNCTTPAAPAADNGCETSTSTDVNHCGMCNRACSATNVASKSCSGGICNSTCDVGFDNCVTPVAPNADNGCELNVAQNDTNCGGCFNDCSGALDCDQGAATQRYCGCSQNNECGSGPGTETCGAGGFCVCDGASCTVGEICVAGAGSVCSCNGSLGCGAFPMACCQSPAGCFNLQTDPANCGACGHSCAAGFACTAGTCRCDADTDCDAGTPGAFSCNLGTGLCVCGATTCVAGERCQPNGTCG